MLQVIMDLFLIIIVTVIASIVLGVGFNAGVIPGSLIILAYVLIITIIIESKPNKNHNNTGPQYVNIPKSDIHTINVSNSNVQHICISGSNIHRVNITGGNIKQVDITGQNIKYVFISGPNIEYINITGSDIYHVYIPILNIRNIRISSHENSPYIVSKTAFAIQLDMLDSHYNQECNTSQFDTYILDVENNKLHAYDKTNVHTFDYVIGRRVLCM